MNFDSEVGNTMTLIAGIFTNKDGVTKFNFRPDFQGFDELVYGAICSTKTKEILRREEDEDSWNMLDEAAFGRSTYGRTRRTPVGPHASMRIFHISGERHPEELREGDAWEVRVVKCYAATRCIPRSGLPDGIEWTEPKTKDGRTKIHFTVIPVKRIVTEDRTVFLREKVMKIKTVCGENVENKEVPIDSVLNGNFRFTDSCGFNWVVVGSIGYIDGVIVACDPFKVQTLNYWMNRMNNESAIKREPKALKRFWREFPEAPEELWNSARERGLVATAAGL